jgi:hypothetical protein
MCSRLVSTTRPIATLFISRMVSRMTAKADFAVGAQWNGSDTSISLRSTNSPISMVRVDSRLRYRVRMRAG